MMNVRFRLTARPPSLTIDVVLPPAVLVWLAALLARHLGLGG